MKKLLVSVFLLSLAIVASAENLATVGSPYVAFHDNYRYQPVYVMASTDSALDTTTPERTIFNETGVYLESVKVVVRYNEYWRLHIMAKSSFRNRDDTVAGPVKFKEIWDTAQGQFTISAGVGVYASNYSDSLGYTLEYTPLHTEYFDAITIKAMRPNTVDTANLRGYTIKYKVKE